MKLKIESKLLQEKLNGKIPIRQYIDMFEALIVFGNWNNSSISGLRCRNLNNVRANSNNNVGGRDYNKPQDF